MPKILFKHAALGLLACWMFASCDFTANEEELTIGIVLPITGTAARPGEEVRKGAALAIAGINSERLLGNTQLLVILEDSKSTVEGAIDAYQKLIDQAGVPIILGPASSSATEGITLATHEAGVVALSPTSSAEGLSAKSPWLFRAALAVDQLVPPGVEHTKMRLGYSRAALIYNDADTFSSSSHFLVKRELASYDDVEVVNEQTFSRPPGSPPLDLSVQFAAIKASGPDVVFMSGLPLDVEQMVLQAHEANIAGMPFIIPEFSASELQYIESQQQGAAEDVVTFARWVISSTHQKSQDFVARFRSQYGADPGEFAAAGYLATRVLASALQHAEDYEAASIRAAFENFGSLDTIVGRFSFNSVGDAMYTPIIAHVEGGKIVPLD